jgi:hypothetical protein
MPDMNMTVESRGPIFDKRGKNIVQKVSNKFLQRIVELGEQRLDEILRPRPMGVYKSAQEARSGITSEGKSYSYASTGNYRRNISGRVQGLTGVIDDGKVVYGAWLEGTSPRNQATQFKGYASFRKTKDWMQKHVSIIRNKFEKEYVKRLNGI